jgi:hypothetical protein
VLKMEPGLDPKVIAEEDEKREALEERIKHP